MSNRYPMLSKLLLDAKNKLTTPLETTNMNIITVEDAVAVIASYCDGAIKNDRVGFNAGHAKMGHECNALYQSGLGWSAVQREKIGLECLTTYAEQLEKHYDKMGLNGKEIVRNLQNNPKFRYKEAFVEDGELFPYVSYSVQTCSFTVQFPAARDGSKYDKLAIQREIRNLFRNGNVNPFYVRGQDREAENKNFYSWIDATWDDGGKKKFNLKDNSLGFIDELKEAGFCIDERIYAVLMDEHKRYLKIEINKVEGDEKYKNMKPYICASIKSFVFNDQFLSDKNSMLVDQEHYIDPEWWKARNSFVLPLGDVNFEALYDFCEKHNVGDRDVLVNRLMNEEEWNMQKRILKDDDINEQLRARFGATFKL